MKILFLGYAISREEAAELYGASIAGNKMQTNVLMNLNKYQDIDIKSITIYPTAAFPRGRAIISRKMISLFDGFYSLRVGFINFPLVKQILETIITYMEAKKIVENEGITTIFTFNMFPQVGLPAKWLKKKYGCEIVTLLADLPIDDTVRRNKLSTILRNFFDNLTREVIPYCDKVIALNKYAVDLYAPNSDFIVVEGGVELSEYQSRPCEKSYSPKNIIYSGALVEYSGILNLIEAMQYVHNKNLNLEIYGGGQLEDYIKTITEKLPNVKYHGKVDNNKMKKLQSEAYLLVNPRPVDDPISMVTFPSKIFEYMMSGTPVLTTKLNGFTQEYLDKMFFVENNHPRIIAEKINEIAELPMEELRNKSLRARDFILQNKTWEKQSGKIYKFLKGLKYE